MAKKLIVLMVCLTTAIAFVPVKPVSQRMFAIASGPESPGRTRSPTRRQSSSASATSPARRPARESPLKRQPLMR